MKITIESTLKDKFAQTATIETYHDDLTMGDVAQLLSQVCISYGFHPLSVSEYINCELSESINKLCGINSPEE